MDPGAEITRLNARIAELEAEVAALRAESRELQQFFYSATHDLKAPLRTVSSFTNLLAKRYQGKLEGDANEFLAFITAATRRMEKLINDLLHYSRLLQDSANPPTDVSMKAVFDWVVMTLNGDVKKTGAQIESGELPVVSGDEQRLVDALQRLFANAIQYRSERPLRIRFTAEERGDDWLFALRDNGIGFEMQYAEQIFGALKRLNNQETEGSGMGLPISRRIIEQHGGKIWVESTPDEGSTFYFTLPK
jgi:light-regulated signal transduction histidine kinase (bacteriophytochrome)